MRYIPRADIADKADELQKRFLKMVPESVNIDVEIFLPAKRLLDFYGEDIRDRAYVTQDGVLGEQMLRPDFTVPIAKYHINKEGVKFSGYCYNGLVWLKRERNSLRPREFRQVGVEVFGAPKPALAEADIFALFFKILNDELGDNLSVTTGDIGLLRAAINGLETTPARRGALLRHLWHPQRFRQLLDKFSGKVRPLASRENLIEQVAAKGFDAVISQAGEPIGKRSVKAIKARVDWLIEDAKTAPLDKKQVALIDAILALDTNAADALAQVQGWQGDHPFLADTLASMSARLTAFEAKGIAPNRLDFKGDYRLTSLEYYDGFVFGFTYKKRKIIASGGRYDILAKRLGKKSLTAIGGVIRPDILLAAKED